MFRKVISISLLIVFSLAFSTDADAQRKRSKKRKPKEEKTETKERSRSSRDRGEQEETASISDRLNYEINIGNITFNQGFGITAKPGVAYKITDKVSAGLAFRTQYQVINIINGDDRSVFHYGGSLFGRYKLSDEIYFQAEYTTMSYDLGTNSDRLNVNSPMLGVGYLSGYGPWQFGIQLLYVVDDQFNDIENIFDYWFSFSYNF